MPNEETTKVFENLFSGVSCNCVAYYNFHAKSENELNEGFGVTCHHFFFYSPNSSKEKARRKETS